MKTNGMILALALGVACMQSARAQSFKKIKVANNIPLVQVASGGASAWALASNGHPYIFKGKSFALANSITLSQIAVGGGNSAQADAVWALDSSGNVYSAARSGTTWTFSPIAHSGFFTAIVAGPGYQDSCHPYEVWGLNSGSEIFRYNFCGLHFDQEPGSLCDIHVGGGEIWGAECGPNTYRFDFSSGTFKLMFNDSFAGFPELSVAPNGQLWAVDTFDGAIYRYDDISNLLARIGCCTSHLQAGGNGVFMLKDNFVYRWEPSVGQSHFLPVQGNLTSLSVGTGGGVWGLDGYNRVYAFTTP